MKTLRVGVLRQERIDDYLKAAVPVVEEYFEQWSKDDSVPLFRSFSHLALAISLTIFLGDDFRRKYGDEVIPMMAHYERDVQDPMLRILPFRLWGWCSAGRRTFKAQNRFDELMVAEMKERLANPEKYAERSDYFNAVLEEFGDKFEACYGQHLISVVFAAHANVGMTTPWMFLHARRTPGALEHWRSEVLAQCNDDDPLETLTTEHASVQRPYLEASIRETARLYTNTLILRLTTKPTQIAGHSLPAWTLVACSPLTSQRDESVFPDATTWNPERFIKDGAYASWFQRGEFIQFGMGMHACPGEKLAKMTILDAVIGTWMRKYEMEVVGGLKEGEVGIGGVGVEAAWTEENLGTPSVRGEDVRVRVKLRGA
jgi:sterol 14-demethylase